MSRIKDINMKQPILFYIYYFCIIKLDTDSLPALPVYMWVSAGCSGFLPQQTQQDESKLTVGLIGCLSHLSVCGSVINW